MALMSYLQAEYGPNEPIITSDIKDDRAKRYLIKSSERLIANGLIERFSRGIYYIPTKTAIGKSKLSSSKVYQRKYISNKNDVYGYYTGTTLLNLMGLTTQVPVVVEIATNRATRNRAYKPKGKVIAEVMPAKTNVNRENVKVLQFLDAVTIINKTTEYTKHEKINKLLSYIAENSITNESIAQYVQFYPKTTKKYLIESGII